MNSRLLRSCTFLWSVRRLPTIVAMAFSLFVSSCSLDADVKELSSEVGLTKIRLISVGGSASITEGSAFALSLAFNRASETGFSLNYTITSSRGDAAQDFVADQGMLVVPQGVQTANLIIQSVNDTMYEGNETFTLTFTTNNADIILGNAAQFGLTVIDDDAIPQISFTAGSINVNENDGTLLIPVSLDRASSQAITVAYSTTLGTASSADIGTSSGTITFAAGETSKNISIAIANDALVEGGETFTVNLGAITGTATLGLASKAVTIIDDDSASLSIADVTVGENATATFTITLSVAAPANVTVDWATANGTALAGTNYTSASGTATILQGQTSATVNVSTLANANICATDKIFTVNLSNAVNASIGDGSADGRIQDANVPTLSIADNSVVEGLSGTITATLSQACPTHDVSFQWQTNTSGTATVTTDFTPVSLSPKTITAGSTSTTLSIATVNDAIDESDETVGVEISNVSGAALGTSTALLTITDNDSAPTVSWTTSSASVYEDGAAVVVTAQLSGASGNDVTVPFTVSGTATLTSDYTISNSPITILAGATTATYTITLVNDTTVESSETVIVTMGTPTNATLGTTTVHTTTILNDDLGAFSVSGVRSAGGLDSTTDAYLNYEHAPSFLFTSSNGATGYDITVYANDGTTVLCALQSTTASPFAPTGCVLTPGLSYKLKVTARISTLYSRETGSSIYSFTYNRAPVVPNRGVWNYQTNTLRSMNVLTDDPATPANDPATDPDGDTLSVVSVTAAARGTSGVLGTSSVTYTSNAGWDGADTFDVYVSDGRGAQTRATITLNVFSRGHWTGLGSDSNWSTAGNWCGAVSTTGVGACTGNTAPTSTDLAVFDSTCTQCNVTIDSAATALGIDARTGYTGTMTQLANANVTLGTSGMLLTSGTFLGSSDANTNFTSGGNFKIASGTTFTAPSGTTKLTKTGVAYLEYELYGTFNHHNGLFAIDHDYNSGGQAMYPTGGINVNSSIDFYNLELSVRNTNAGYPGRVVLPDATDTINVLNDLTIRSGGIAGYVSGGTATQSGQINLYGNLIANCSTSGTCAKTNSESYSTNINIVGNTNTTYTVLSEAAGAPAIPNIILNKGNDIYTLTSTDNRAVRLSSLEIQKGAFTAPSNGLTLGRDWAYPITTSASGGLKVTGGSFSMPAGTLELRSNNGSSAGSPMRTIAVELNQPVTVPNLSVAVANSNWGVYAQFSGTQNMVVTGDIELENGAMASGQVDLYGNLYATCTSTTLCAKKLRSITNTRIAFKGSTAQTYYITPAASGLPNASAPAFLIVKDNASDTVSPQAGSTFNTTYIEARKGTLNLTTDAYLGAFGSSGGGVKITSADAHIVQSSGTLTIDANAYANATNSTGATFSLGGFGLTLNNLVVSMTNSYSVSATNRTNVTIDTGDTITVNGNLTVNRGTFYVATDTPTVANLVVSGNVTLNCADPTTTTCALQTLNRGARLRMTGAGKTITQAAGADFIFKVLDINLPNQSDTVRLMSSINGKSNTLGTPWMNINHEKGVIDLNGYSWTNVNTLTVTAGATCLAPITYATGSGISGSGCGI